MYTVLPNKEELLEKLISISSESGLVKDYYPILLQYANSEKVGTGIVMMLVSSIAQYTEGMATETVAALYLYVPDFIEVLTEGNEEVRKEALETWQIVRSG